MDNIATLYLSKLLCFCYNILSEAWIRLYFSMIKLLILVDITNIIILIYYNACVLLAWYKEI